MGNLYTYNIEWHFSQDNFLWILFTHWSNNEDNLQLVTAHLLKSPVQSLESPLRDSALFIIWHIRSQGLSFFMFMLYSFQIDMLENH